MLKTLKNDSHVKLWLLQPEEARSEVKEEKNATVAGLLPRVRHATNGGNRGSRFREIQGKDECPSLTEPMICNHSDKSELKMKNLTDVELKKYLDKIRTETLLAYGVYQIEADGLNLFE